METKWQPYLEQLYEMGAERAVTVEPRNVLTAPWTAFRCQFGCDHYGASFCCPPKTPDDRRTREILDSFQTGILFMTHRLNASEMARKTARAAFLDGFYKALAFGSGPCLICKTCAPQRCAFPEKAVPSMEACGIDVFQTARSHGFEIRVLAEQGEEHNHFGLVLLE